MRVYEKVILQENPIVTSGKGLANFYRDLSNKYTAYDETIIRFVATGKFVELGLLENRSERDTNIFNYSTSLPKSLREFNIAFIIPTGINASIGGHSGDGGATVRLFSSICDNLITHPNTVNASDLNELPDNGMYVEGSILSRFLMGKIGLQKTRANNIGVLLCNHEDERVVNDAINSVNAARATMGISISCLMGASFNTRATFTKSGRASGIVDGIENVISILREYENEYDVIAVSSPISLERTLAKEYFKQDEIVNPWGGAEAILTHTITKLLGKPSAHAPMVVEMDDFNEDYGIVDPTKAAESVSITNFHCVLKGLHRAPKIVDVLSKDAMTVSDVDCIVMPDKCFGIPTLASIIHNIPLIAVRENTNLMNNDLSKFENVIFADTYLEAVGIASAIKAGISLDTLKRPIKKLKVREV